MFAPAPTDIHKPMNAFRTCRLLTFGLILGASSLSFAANPDRLLQEDAIRAAFISEILSLAPSTNVYFLCIQDRAPSNRLLASLSAFKSQIRKCSKSFHSEQRKLQADRPPNSVSQLNIDRIKWVSPTEVEFGASFYFGPLAAGGVTITMKKTEKRWEIKGESNAWRS